MKPSIRRIEAVADQPAALVVCGVEDDDNGSAEALAEALPMRGSSALPAIVAR